MKKFLLGSVALIALGAMPAMAADLGARTYTKAPAYAPVPLYNWTGFYIGGHVGGAFAGQDFNGTSNDGQFIGGVQGGYDYQFAPNWVFGVEGQYSWTGNNSNNYNLASGYVYTNRDRGLGSATGRLGYTWGPALLYVKGGYAFADLNESLVNAAGVGQAFNGGKKDGYTVGAGLEYMFAPSWSAKVEYQYYDFGKTNFTTALPAVLAYQYNNTEHTVKAGLNYRFNWGGPVVAKY